MKREELASSFSPSIFPSPPPVPSYALVYDLDIFILAVIFVFALFNVPRAVVYVANNGSQVFQGYFLHFSTQSEVHPPRSPELTEPSPKEESKEEESEEYSISAPASSCTTKEPWHLPMHLSFRHPAVDFTQFRVFENHTVVQVVLMAGYTAVILFTAFYGSNPFTQPVRAGWVITSQIPFVYAFAAKNNVIGLLVGVGYEKLNYLHRHVGRLIVIGANVHSIGYIYKWGLAGVITDKFALSHVRWGFLSLVCCDLLGFISLERVRTKFYNLFFWTHIVGSSVILFAACLHKPACIPFVTAGSVVYGLDHVIRVIKTRHATATLRAIPALGLTQVDIPSINAGWRPGQHVRLRILSTGLGLLGMTEVHPFTIAGTTNTEQGLTVMCKKTGKWTTKLYEMAQRAASESDEQGQGSEMRVKVIVEGPYGGIGDTTVPNYSGAMFVVGGSGVTFVLSWIQDLVLANDKSRIKFIDVAWSITDPAALEPFIPLFTDLLSRKSYARLRFSVYHTRATSRSLDGYTLPQGITLNPGRPKIEKLLNGLVTSMMSECDAHGAFVAVCGPVSLSKDVAHAVATYDATSKKAIGGIHLHEEVFGW